LLSLLTLAAGCGGEVQSEPSMVTKPERPFFYEQEFAENPTLAAQPHQTVILDLQPASSGLAAFEHVTWYQLDEGTYTFCMEEDDPYLQSLILENEAGVSVLKLERASGCVEATLPSGNYRMRIFHDGSAIAEGEAHRVAFVHTEKPSVPLLDGSGIPRSGFWALRPDPSLDPSGHRREGRVRAVAPPKNLDGVFYTAVEPLMVDFSSKQIDDTALFNFQSLGGNAPLGGVPFVLSDQFPLDLTVLLGDPKTSSSILFADANGLENTNKFGIDPLSIVDVGNQTVQLQARPNLFQGGPYESFFVDSDLVIKWANKPASAPYLSVEVLFRFLPDGLQEDLREGEVALFQECNYQGRATVFVLDAPDFSALTSSVTTLDKTTASVKLGPNTAALLYSGGTFSGASQLITADTPCLDGTPIGRTTTSIRVGTLLRLFLVSSSCVNCNLSGVDLSDKDVSGADLQGANLSGANLTKTVLHNAKSLVGTIFTGATLACTDLSGSENHLVDLTKTLFDSAKFIQDFSCRANFSYTKVDAGHVEPRLWRYLNLSHATLIPLLHVSNLDLSDALLTGASLQDAVYPSVILTGANLAGANLTGTALQSGNFENAVLDGVIGLAGTKARPSDLSGARFNNTSLKNTDLSDALLYGANFTNANLEGASLRSAFLTNNLNAGIRDPANFTGAHLKNVNLSSAQLNGTIFDTASFYGSFDGVAPKFPCQTDTSMCPDAKTGFTCGCATAVGASMVDTQFANAYLYGVDFSGATTTINGVKFTGAILVGANFADANFSVDPTKGGAPPDFSNAYLQGVNLAGANLTDTSLDGAFVDFGAPTNQNNGNIMQLLLGPQYTAFNGWEAPNAPVCVQAAYDSYTTVPTTIPSMTCPDGNQYASGCGATQQSNMQWASHTPLGQATPPGWYQYDATYTKANQSQACNGTTFNEDW
jgi:uncharacterized protein YjbI with pentapeptide repeats